MKLASRNCYEILDVDPTASVEEVKRAYRMVKRTWTPGSMATYSLYTPEESELIRHKIEEAVQILMSPEHRRRYDRYLRFMGRDLTRINTPTEFFEGVRADGQQGERPLEMLADLFSQGEREGMEALEQKALAAAAAEGNTSPLPFGPEAEREWEEIIAESPEPAPLPLPRAQVRTWTGIGAHLHPKQPHTREGGTPPAPTRLWSRPQRTSPNTPEPLAEKLVTPEQITTLEATWGITGKLLEKVREAKGISVEVIAERTKIGIGYLRAIEGDQFDDLPPAVYLRGFLVQYVKLLKLDTARVVEAYMARFVRARGEE